VGDGRVDERTGHGPCLGAGDVDADRGGGRGDVQREHRRRVGLLHQYDLERHVPEDQ
jgi:hypothetical protein